MPLSELQYFGGAQEWRWQATSPREGRSGRGPASSLLPLGGIVRAVRFDGPQAGVTMARQKAANAMARSWLDVPRISERW